ncbi:MAG: hypothetical protein COS08_07850 [Euryarchaeota archaeon CG01_land_8_20_14_3_00_38_12]|nr:MAG: hypothetical protein COS08_07850 [Euryarchaeota archaeon CG01_land_8_20_14_3_00_38_12]PJB21488.1 MAG: hypothetical protein CO114_05080 [Euryarchaeota archaeon CG_4_9_14_3_um_filter_38_12]
MGALSLWDDPEWSSINKNANAVRAVNNDGAQQIDFAHLRYHSIALSAPSNKMQFATRVVICPKQGFDCRSVSSKTINQGI